VVRTAADPGASTWKTKNTVSTATDGSCWRFHGDWRVYIANVVELRCYHVDHGCGGKQAYRCRPAHARQRVQDHQLANINNLLFIIFAIPAGILIDRKGFRYAVVLGAVLTAGFSYLRMFSGNYWLVFLGMCGIAIGGPFVLVAITKMVSAWFPTEESALAVGLATLSTFLGEIAALALTPALLKLSVTPSPGALDVLVYSLARPPVLFSSGCSPRRNRPSRPSGPNRSCRRGRRHQLASFGKNLQALRLQAAVHHHVHRVRCDHGHLAAHRPDTEAEGINSTTSAS